MLLSVIDSALCGFEDCASIRLLSQQINAGCGFQRFSCIEVQCLGHLVAADSATEGVGPHIAIHQAKEGQPTGAHAIAREHIGLVHELRQRPVFAPGAVDQLDGFDQAGRAVCIACDLPRIRCGAHLCPAGRGIGQRTADSLDVAVRGLQDGRDNAGIAIGFGQQGRVHAAHGLLRQCPILAAHRGSFVLGRHSLDEGAHEVCVAQLVHVAATVQVQNVLRQVRHIGHCLLGSGHGGLIALVGLARQRGGLGHAHGIGDPHQNRLVEFPDRIALRG